MRLGWNGPVIGVWLSERNLLSLLTKLYEEDSARTLVSPNNDFVVTAEHDADHYDGRLAPPGPMHPRTEAVLKAIRDVSP